MDYWIAPKRLNCIVFTEESPDDHPPPSHHATSAGPLSYLRSQDLSSIAMPQKTKILVRSIFLSCDSLPPTGAHVPHAVCHESHHVILLVMLTMTIDAGRAREPLDFKIARMFLCGRQRSLSLLRSERLVAVWNYHWSCLGLDGRRQASQAPKEPPSDSLKLRDERNAKRRGQAMKLKSDGDS
jgi:hypothetical protein